MLDWKYGPDAPVNALMEVEVAWPAMVAWVTPSEDGSWMAALGRLEDTPSDLGRYHSRDRAMETLEELLSEINSGNYRFVSWDDDFGAEVILDIDFAIIGYRKARTDAGKAAGDTAAAGHDVGDGNSQIPGSAPSQPTPSGT